MPDACPMLTLRLDGDGRILGAGNGDPAYLGEDHPKDPDCREFRIPAFNGLAQVIVQSTHTPSALQLTVSSDKLKPASLSINSGSESK